MNTFSGGRGDSPVSCCRLNLPSQVLLHWCLTLKVLVLRRRGGGGAEGKWLKKKKKRLEKTGANTGTKLFISTVSRRGQPTGRSILAEVLRRMIYTVAFPPLHESSDVHITHTCMYTHLSPENSSIARMFSLSFTPHRLCVCVCY